MSHFFSYKTDFILPMTSERSRNFSKNIFHNTDLGEVAHNKILDSDMKTKQILPYDIFCRTFFLHLHP